MPESLISRKETRTMKTKTNVKAGIIAI